MKKNYFYSGLIKTGNNCETPLLTFHGFVSKDKIETAHDFDQLLTDIAYRLREEHSFLRSHGSGEWTRARLVLTAFNSI